MLPTPPIRAPSAESQASELPNRDGTDHNPKTVVVETRIQEVPAANGRSRIDKMVEPRPAPQDAGCIARFLDAVGVLIFIEAPLPDVAAQIEHIIGRGALRVHAHGAALLQIVRADLAGGLVDVGMTRLIFLASPGVAMAVVAAGGFLPLPFGGQGNAPGALAAQRRGQQAGRGLRFGREPAAKGDGVPPAYVFARVVPEAKVLLPRLGPVFRRRGQPLPPLRVVKAVSGIKKGLELSIGDGVAGDLG